MEGYFRQDVRINVLDADTKQLIQKDIFIDKGLYSPTPYNEYHCLQAGTGIQKLDVRGTITIEFVEEQITALGYNYNSIEGNVIAIVADPLTNAPMYPWVVNVYMRKL